jgi:Domain of unknown function (DUF4124)
MGRHLSGTAIGHRRRVSWATALALSLALAASEASAGDEIFRSVDKDGRPVFSDQGDKGGEPVTLPSTNTVPAFKPDNRPRGRTVEAVEQYQSCAITSPADGASIVNTGGVFSVTANVVPKLMEGHRLQLLIDGAPFGSSQAAGEFQVSGFRHGSHTLQVQVIDATGAVVIASSPVTLYLHHATAAKRRARNPGRN